MAEDSAFPREEHRRAIAAIATEIRMPDRVYPAMDLMEAAGCDSTVDRIRPEAKPHELIAVCDAFLPRCEPCDRGLDPVSVTLTANAAVNVTLGRHGREHAAAGVTELRASVT
jgi:hypothetical protein